MADVKLNFSTQWPSVQVSRVINISTESGEVVANSTRYTRKYRHGLGYPPMALYFGANAGANTDPMGGVDVDDTYIYTDAKTGSRGDIETIVVYALDITQNYEYPDRSSYIGNVPSDGTRDSLDLRKFMLHSRAVSPMVFAVRTKKYTPSDKTLTYKSNLPYPTFQLGYVKWAVTAYGMIAGIWQYAPLASQSWPALSSDGYTSTLLGDGDVSSDGTIITLRNPAIITNNTVYVTI